MSNMLAPYFDHLERASSLRWSGRVLQVVGNLVESEGPFCSVGDGCDIVSADGTSYAGEVVGFRGPVMLTMTLQMPRGIRYGDRIVASGTRPSIRAGEALLGRVIDGNGDALDGLGPYVARQSMPVDCSAPLPLSRVPISQALGCGVRSMPL